MENKVELSLPPSTLGLGFNPHIAVLTLNLEASNTDLAQTRDVLARAVQVLDYKLADTIYGDYSEYEHRNRTD